MSANDYWDSILKQDRIQHAKDLREAGKPWDQCPAEFMDTKITRLLDGNVMVTCIKCNATWKTSNPDFPIPEDNSFWLCSECLYDKRMARENKEKMEDKK